MINNSKKLLYLEQLANLTFDYTFLLNVESNDEIIPEIIIGSFENITGYSLNEIREKNFFLSIIYEKDYRNFLDYWGNIISGKPDTIITRILTKSNEIKWVKIYSNPIVEELSGRISMILGAVQDITEQKLMEAVIKESELTYRYLLENMGEGIIMSDKSNHILYVNRKFSEMLQYSQKEIIGKIGYDLFVEKKEKERIIGKNANRESGISEVYESVFIKKNGKQINVSISGTPYKNEKGMLIGSLAVINDITEHKKNLTLLKKQKDEIDILYNAGKMLSQKLDVQSIFNTVFSVISGVVDFSELFVAEYIEAEKLIKYIYIRSVNGTEPADISKVPAIPLAPEGYGIISDVIRKSESIIFNDYQETLKKSKTLVRVSVTSKDSSSGINNNQSVPHSAIIVPIKLDNKVLGVIQLYSQNKNAYNEEQLVFLEALMQQASLAYHNAKLFQKAQDEIKERKRAEERLTLMIDEREILLKEIYHRVKNNLQIVSSLLNMQSEKFEDPLVKKYFLDSKDKVSAISLIHEKLYRMRNLSKIDFSDYIESLVKNLKNIYTFNNPVDIKVNSEKLFLPVDIAMPCGLILNELIINALKHPFDNNSINPEIKLNFTFDKSENLYLLSVTDNGKGFPNDINIKNSESMGLNLVKTLIKQIDGVIQITCKNGTEILMKFPPSSYTDRL